MDGLPHALDEYRPDGVYPEGSTYWGYGTAFSVVTNAMLESAFGTDFGLGDYPGFKDSAYFRLLMNAPLVGIIIMQIVAIKELVILMLHLHGLPRNQEMSYFSKEKDF